MNKRIRDRFIIISIIFSIFGTLAVSQLVNLQLVSGAENYDKSQSRLLSDRRIPAPRGNILDRYGVPLATSRQGFIVQIVKTNTKTADLNSMLLKLVNLLEKNGDEYINGINRYISIEDGIIVYGTTIAKIGESEEGLTQEEKNAKKIDKIKQDIGITYKDFNANTPEEVFKYFRSSRMFNIESSYSDADAFKIMCIRFELFIKGFTAVNPVTIATNVSDKSVAVIEEMHDGYPGVATELMYARKYNNATVAPHVIGYMRTMDADSYKSLKDKGYRMDDVIGRAGVEYAAESYLKGKDGLKSIEMDISGRTTKELDTKSPIPGDNVVLTIDTRLQKVAMDSLAKNIVSIRTAGGSNNFGDALAGSAVAIDVSNGEILAMASFPSYDPATYLEDAENKEAQKQIADWMTDEKNRPMTNRSIQDIYAPGSTYKPIVGIAGLEAGTISKYDVINDTGTVNIGGMLFYCMEYRDYGYTHGPITLSKALATSCNIFFHILGNNTGIDTLDKWAKSFGLGEKTGIDIDQYLEAKGIRANRAFKKERANAINKQIKDKAAKTGRQVNSNELEYGEWTPADTAQSSIGQLYNSFTPLQIANYISTIANGGKKFKPHVIKKIVQYDGTVIQETQPEYEQIPVNPETIAAVKEGMVAVANAQDGTAVGIFNGLTYNGKPIQVAGKTGTAETGFANASSNALFVSYAPADDPKIAVAVVIERGAWGSFAAPVARDILKEYFDINNTTVTDDKIPSEDVTLTK